MGPPGPGKAVWGLCRDHSVKMDMMDSLYGAKPCPETGSAGGQHGNSAGMTLNAMIHVVNIINIINVL